MEKLVINSFEEFASHEGQQLGISDWLLVDQNRINQFALSLLPHLWGQIIEVNHLKMMVNYGMDKMRFGVPVITGSRIRLNAKLDKIENLRGICKAYIGFKIEIEGQRKPALQGEAQFLYYFE